jgi:copper homeostasis protein
MNRPRQAGFSYSAAEFAVMERDAESLLEHGADGVVFGILHGDGSIDVRRTRSLRQRIGAHQAIFHRAFDVTPDPFRALEELIDLGITRVLTSGQKNAAPEGVELIARLIEKADGRIEVLPGAGITVANARQFVAATRCRQIHLTAFGTQQDASTLANPAIQFGSPFGPPESQFELTDRDVVRRIREELFAI